MNDADHSQADWARLEQRLSSATWKETISAMTLGFMHDLNNALTGILGLADALLLEEKPGEAAHESLTLIKRSTQQAAALVDQIARLHSAVPGKADCHDLNRVVSQTLEFLRRAVPKRLRFESSLWPVVLPVRADAVELQHALARLVLLAARTISGNGTLLIQTSRQDKPAAGEPGFVAWPAPTAILALTEGGKGAPRGSAAIVLAARPDDNALFDIQQARRCVEKCGGTLVVDSAGQTGIAMRILLPLDTLGEPDAPLPQKGP